MYKVSVPGSIMLFGEHAVLHGKTAIVAAIDARLHVELIPNDSNDINITCVFGNISLSLNNLNNSDSFENFVNLNNLAWQFVLSAIQFFNSQQKIIFGFNLVIINKNLKNSVGFGSSAAVVVGVLAVLNKCFCLEQSTLEEKLFKNLIFKQALQVVLKVQNNIGSGSDVAASVYGGIVSIKNHIIQAQFNKKFKLTAVYCGYKTATADVVKIINNNMINNKNFKMLYKYIFDNIENCSKSAIVAIEQNDLDMLGKLFNIAHGFMSGLGIVDATLDRLVCDLRAQQAIYGAKVSGSGLGDCVIGLGKLPDQIFKENQFNLQIAEQGINLSV